MNARLVWVTKYDLSFFFFKKKKEREREREIHFRSSGFSNQDFYTATVLHLILCASFNYENKSSFLNSSPWKLQDQSQGIVATRCFCPGASKIAVEGQAPLLLTSLLNLNRTHSVCILASDALETLYGSL